MATEKIATSTGETRTVAGVVGFFDDPMDLMAATRKVRDSRFRHFDVYTPYPVHGLDAAQGLKRSRIPYVTLVAGLTGCTLAFSFQYWTSVIDWPLIVGGKPFNSWPAFVPVMFELTVLFAGLSTLGALLFFNRLPNITKKSFDPAITRDRFAIAIEGDGKQPVPEAEAAEFLRKVGAKEVKTVYAEGWF